MLPVMNNYVSRNLLRYIYIYIYQFSFITACQHESGSIIEDAGQSLTFSCMKSQCVNSEIDEQQLSTDICSKQCIYFKMITAKRCILVWSNCQVMHQD